MNLVVQNREELAKKNYVLKNGEGWIGLSQNKILSYSKATDSHFDIILFGNEQEKDDYYRIPYHAIKVFLIAENLDKSGRSRWLGWVKGKKLKISNSGIWIDISQFYGSNFDTPFNSEEITDFSAENKRIEVNVRTGQEKFRADVLNNFNSKCCLTDATEPDLLQASHIFGWADKKETRLDPKNGLCLSVAYHKLFDQGYFTFDDDFRVIVTEKIDHLSEETRRQLQAIRGKRLRDPRKYPIDLKAIEHHRKNIFEKKLHH